MWGSGKDSGVYFCIYYLSETAQSLLPNYSSQNAASLHGFTVMKDSHYYVTTYKSILRDRLLCRREVVRNETVINATVQQQRDPSNTAAIILGDMLPLSIRQASRRRKMIMTKKPIQNVASHDQLPLKIPFVETPNYTANQQSWSSLKQIPQILPPIVGLRDGITQSTRTLPLMLDPRNLKHQILWKYSTISAPQGEKLNMLLDLTGPSWSSRKKIAGILPCIFGAQLSTNSPWELPLILEPENLRNRVTSSRAISTATLKDEKANPLLNHKHRTTQRPWLLTILRNEMSKNGKSRDFASTYYYHQDVASKMLWPQLLMLKAQGKNMRLPWTLPQLIGTQPLDKYRMKQLPWPLLLLTREDLSTHVLDIKLPTSSHYHSHYATTLMPWLQPATLNSKSGSRQMQNQIPWPLSLLAFKVRKSNINCTLPQATTNTYEAVQLPWTRFFGNVSPDSKSRVNWFSILDGNMSGPVRPNAGLQPAWPLRQILSPRNEKDPLLQPRLPLIDLQYTTTQQPLALPQILDSKTRDLQKWACFLRKVTSKDKLKSIMLPSTEALTQKNIPHQYNHFLNVRTAFQNTTESELWTLPLILGLYSTSGWATLSSSGTPDIDDLAWVIHNAMKEDTNSSTKQSTNIFEYQIDTTNPPETLESSTENVTALVESFADYRHWTDAYRYIVSNDQESTPKTPRDPPWPSQNTELDYLTTEILYISVPMTIQRTTDQTILVFSAESFIDNRHWPVSYRYPIKPCNGTILESLQTSTQRLLTTDTLPTHVYKDLGTWPVRYRYTIQMTTVRSTKPTTTELTIARKPIIKDHWQNRLWKEFNNDKSRVPNTHKPNKTFSVADRYEEGQFFKRPRAPLHSGRKPLPKTQVGDYCYVCGLTETGIPSRKCRDTFLRDEVLPKKTHTYCKQAENIGGCFHRSLDVDSVYIEKGCRVNPPKQGLSYASARFQALERLLNQTLDGCVRSPVATLTPFSRAISLYVTYEACVCSQHLCNNAMRTSVQVVVFIPIAYIKWDSIV